MDNKPINQVLNQLEKYQETTRRLELLRYEIQHLDRVTPSDVIEMMTFQKDVADSNHDTPYPKAVPEIALSYRQVAERLNAEAVDELLSVYADLCQTHDRLLHYIGLLDPRQQSVIRKYYFESCTWNEIADALGITTRTAQRTGSRPLRSWPTCIHLPTMCSAADKKRNIFQNKVAFCAHLPLHPPQSYRTIALRVSFCTLKSSYFISYEEELHNGKERK